MVFQSDTYSVLLVSASEKYNTAMMSLLPPTDFWPVTTAARISQARRCVLENTYDIILVNSPLPDGSALPFCIDVCAGSESAVALLVRSEQYEETYYNCLSQGIVTLPKPTSAETLALTLRFLCTVRERLRSARKKQATVEEKMEELRFMNRAKWRLIEHEHLSESEAHQYILDQAMQRRISKKEMAKIILSSLPSE